MKGVGSNSLILRSGARACNARRWLDRLHYTFMAIPTFATGDKKRSGAPCSPPIISLSVEFPV